MSLMPAWYGTETDIRRIFVKTPCAEGKRDSWQEWSVNVSSSDRLVPTSTSRVLDRNRYSTEI